MIPLAVGRAGRERCSGVRVVGNGRPLPDTTQRGSGVKSDAVVPIRSPGRRVFFDLTDFLLFVGSNPRISGIQRVMLRVVGTLTDTYGRDNVRLVAWHHSRKAFVEIENDWCSGRYQYDQETLCDWFGVPMENRGLALSHWVRRYDGRPLRKAYHLMRGLIYAATGHRRFFTKNRIAVPFTGEPAARYPSGCKLQPVKLESGDTLVLLGASWGLDDFHRDLSAAKAGGVRIVSYIHDLVPLRASEHVTRSLPVHYDNWLGRMAELTECFMVNSGQTGHDLGRELARRGASPVIRHVPLAHEFVEPPEVRTIPRSADREDRAISDKVRTAARLPFALFVGTMESRKNVWGLAQVWRRLISTHKLSAPRLVMAGTRGQFIGDFDALMTTTGNLGGYVQIIESPTDAELAFLYRASLFTVYPSFYEGWGLPVGESLWFGKTCVTSSIAAMPEVGGDMCDYADPHDLNDLYRKVERIAFDADHRLAFERRIQSGNLRRWADVADEIWRIASSHDIHDPVRQSTGNRQQSGTPGALQT